ncbi:MAG TPA: Gfo/Idh/MocA family oxidoreductase [Chloroflexota bacterium]|nr:Gfo/Idh/MocA family oxidoreductase [Chloroflexota bacterium]
MTKEKVLRFGVAGIGAAEYEIQAVLRHPGFRLAALADIEQEILTSACQRYGAPGFASVEALCHSGLIDAVYIGTPTHLHTEHALMGIEAGLHVIVAKPMALSLEDAERMTQAADRKGVQLMVGHTQAFEPPVLRMREIIESGELGSLGMINGWYYTDWIYRGRKPEELVTEKGGGVVYRQGAHHFDIARLLGGGLVGSVRAMTGRWDVRRRTEGAYAAFLHFESGAAATVVFNGYDHFRSTELGFPISEGGLEVHHEAYGQARASVAAASPEGELTLKRARRRREPGERHQSFYGVTVVSCERGDIRQSPDGLLIYGDDGSREVPLPPGLTGRDVMLEELHQAVTTGTPAPHNGRWGKATLEVSLAVLQSARERQEIALSHQVPYRPAASSSLR